MSDYQPSSEDRILELLADQALFGLDADEQEELDGLLAAMPDFDKECMERLAATVHLASVAQEPESMPESIKQRIRAKAQQSRGF